MALNTTTPRVEYTASSSQVQFTFSFKVFDDTDLLVYQTPTGQTANDETDILTLTTDYTVTIDGDDGGYITLTSGATSGDKITLTRSLVVVRETDYQQGGDILADVMDNDQNYQTYMIQDLNISKTRYIQLPNSLQGTSNVLPSPNADYYIKWNSSGNALENDETIPDAVIDTSDNVLNANSWANEAEDVPVKVYTNGVGADRVPTVYSAKHYQAKAEGFKDGAELEKWDAEAKALTALSYATEAEDTPVNVVTSDGDGTFTYTPQAGVFSSLHYAAKAATFNPALYALLTGATFTGQVKGITPVSPEDLTRKDYVDTFAAANTTHLTTFNISKQGLYSVYGNGLGDAPESGALYWGVSVTGNAGTVRGMTAVNRLNGNTYARGWNGSAWTSWKRLDGIGEGQTWQDLTASRSAGVTYTNTSGKTIIVSVKGLVNAGSSVIFVVDGVLSHVNRSTYQQSYESIQVIVPNGSTYNYSVGGSMTEWYELR